MVIASQQPQLFFGSCGLLLPIKARESFGPPITSLGKDKNLPFEVGFLLNAYCFCAIGKVDETISWIIVG